VFIVIIYIYSTLRTAQGRNKELVILRLCMGECFLDRWLDPLCEKSVQVTVSSAVRKASILNYSLIYVKKAECCPYADNKNRKKP
jgi:hypothetical protein